MGRGAWSPAPPGDAVNHDITASAGAESASTRPAAICPATDGLAPRMGGNASLKECKTPAAAAWSVDHSVSWESAAPVRRRRSDSAAAEGTNALLYMALSAHPCGGTTSLLGSSTRAG